MPYGNPEKLGAGIDPRMFVQDYSGFADAAKIQAAGLLNFGNQVGGAVADYAKEKKDLSAKMKTADFILKAVEMKFPDSKDYFANLRNELQNPNLSPTDAGALADSVSGLVSMGVAEDHRQQALAKAQSNQNSATDAFFGTGQVGVASNLPQPAPLGNHPADAAPYQATSSPFVTKKVPGNNPYAWMQSGYDPGVLPPL